MQPIAAPLVVAVLFVVVNIITPSFTAVRWSTPVAMGWTSRVNHNLKQNSLSLRYPATICCRVQQAICAMESYPSCRIKLFQNVNFWYVLVTVPKICLIKPMAADTGDSAPKKSKNTYSTIWTSAICFESKQCVSITSVLILTSNALCFPRLFLRVSVVFPFVPTHFCLYALCT